ncbi:glutathione S-transferase family protein [Algiphilus sp.]|uniref:glutathione S-transferase family protein n=1 Tax=Algiphilus sp. TaxID=1872431 RepID=UPI003BAAD7B8
MDETAPRYTVYKMDISYFSGKLEAYLRNKGIAYVAQDADARTLDRIHRATGAKKVPAVEMADGRWLFDTTPMLDWFEQQHPEPALTPTDPALAFVAALVEDYADEWLWRPAMWWRWEPIPTRLALGWRIAQIVDFPAVHNGVFARYFAHRQRQTWLRDDGVNAGNAEAVRAVYLHELDTLQTVLSQQPYLLGARPSAADFGYFASMFRHFGNDPDPAEHMRRRAPAVYEWLARLWNGGPARFGGEARWQWPEAPHWAGLWRRIAQDYLPYLYANACAYRDGRKRFDVACAAFALKGTVTHRYRVWCRQALQRRFAALDVDAQSRVEALFAAHGGLQALHADGVIDACMEDHFVLPKVAGDFRPSLRVALMGQPRD